MHFIALHKYEVFVAGSTTVQNYKDGLSNVSVFADEI